MKRLLVVVVLLSLMLFMRSFQAHTDAADNVLTLAAIGFVVLTTFAVADMGTRFSLPRVTGFIVTGVALGPSAANILSHDVVTEMRMFNTLALGLIATSAGLELNLKAILPLLKTLGSTTAVKVLVGAPLVGLTLFGSSHFIDLGVTGFESRAALATVMGVLSIGTSPSIALAILTETKAKGRLSDLVLGAAVFKDLVVVVCLAVGVAAAAALMDPSSRTDSSVLVHVGRELAGSLLAGAILGAILIAYVRFVQAEMLLFVAAMILVVAELCQVFHLELLLVFISAGFTVRNFSSYEHELMRPLELVALPVFVVFFTIAGASIQLSTAWAIMPAALAVCVVRAAVYWAAAFVGNAVGRESPVIKRNSWLAYLPQAGVTLGLVGIAAQKLPALGPQITTVGMAIVAVNLLIGPITLRLALSRAGEIPGITGDTNDSSQTAQPASGQNQTPQAPIGDLPDSLERYVETIRVATTSSFLAAWDSLKSSATDQAEEPSLEERLGVVRAFRLVAKGWYESWASGLTSLPVQVVVSRPLASLSSHPGDGRWMRLRLWGQRVRWKLSAGFRSRRVPVRLCARLTIEKTVAKVAAQLFDSALERQFAPMISATSNAVGRASCLQHELDRAVAEFARLLGTCGTVRVDPGGLHFSAVEPQIRTQIAQLDETRDEAHAARAGAFWGSEVAKRHIANLRKGVSGLLSLHLTGPARDGMTLTTTAIGRLGHDLSELGRNMESSSSVDIMRAAQREFNEAQQRVLDALSQSIPRASHGVRELGSALRSDIEKLPSEIRCYYPPASPSDAHGTIRRLNLRDVAETHLIRRLMPTLDQSARGLSNSFVHLPGEVKTCLEPATLLLEASNDDVSGWVGVRQRLQASSSRLTTLSELIVHQIEEEIDRQEVATLASLDALEREVSTAQLLGETTSHRLRHFASHLARRLRPSLDSRRSGRTTSADAHGLLSVTTRWLHPSVNADAAGWLSQQPVRDERIYSDRAKTLDRVLQLEAGWREGKRVAVLVCGEAGCGKTSLLNMCELELRSSRIFRLDAEAPEQAFTLSQTIANLLGCRPTESAVAYALAAQKPILLVDNLQRWLSRGFDPIEELANILLLIARARETLWVVAVDPALEERVSSLATVSAPFTVRIDIPTITRGDIQAMVASRAERAKHVVQFRPTTLGKLLHRLGVPGDELLYYASLTSASRGSPGRALALALATANGSERRLELDPRRLPPPVPPLGEHLTATQLVSLLTILQYGPSNVGALASRVGTDLDWAELDLSFLQSAGLVLADNRSYAIADTVRWIVIDELERIGALRLRGAIAGRKPRLTLVLRWLAAACLAIPGVLLSSRATPTFGWQAALVLAGAALLCLPALQNASAGLFLRWVSPFRVGDAVRTRGVYGTVVRVNTTHLELRDTIGGTSVVPYNKLLGQQLSVQGGTRYGARIRAHLPLVRVTPTVEQQILRAAYMCPYRKPESVVSVFIQPGQVLVEFYSWHRDSTKHVEKYLASCVSRSIQNQTPIPRPQE